MRGRLSLLILLLSLPIAGISQTPAPTLRDQVLQHLAGKASDTGKYLSHHDSIKLMGTNAVPILLEILGSQKSQGYQWYEKAPEIIRGKMTKAQYHERLQYEASQSLLEMTETQAFLPRLISLLQDPRIEVRLLAAWALSGHAYKADNDLLLTALPVLRDSESEVRSMMISVFFSSAELPPIKTALEETLHDSNEGVRSSAAYALLMNADSDHDAALATLISLFSSTNVQTRYFAAYYYTTSKPSNLRLETRLIPIYTDVLSVGDTNLQALAMSSLSRYGRRVQHLVPQLQTFLTSPHLSLREAATNALQQIQPETLPGNPAAPASRELVLQHLQTLFTTNQPMAFQSIKAMGTNAVPLLIEILGYETTQADQWYEKVYKKAPSSVQGVMSKPEALEKLREEASLLLLNMPETHLYMTNLFALLQDRRAEVRQHSASLIASHMLNRGRYMEDAVMLECLPALKDSDPMVRRYIAQAFAKKGAGLPRAKAALETTLNDPVEEVRMSAANALLNADGNHQAALQTLKTVFSSTNASNRYFAAAYYMNSNQAKGRAEDELLSVVLNALSSSNADFQKGACNMASRLGPRAKTAVPVLLKHLQSTDPELQMAAREALEKIAPEVLTPTKP